MKATIFAQENYKSYLRERIREHGAVRGYQGRMAEAMGCQKSFLSQVLNGSMQLSRDQAAELTRFLGLEGADAEFFLLLVDKERASSPRLRQMTEAKLALLRKEMQELSGRVRKDSLREQLAEMSYYSSWGWSAVHILVSIPQYQRADAIAQRLGLPLRQVVRILRRLQEFGLVERREGRWTATRKDIHLPPESPMSESNHRNWRERATANVQLGDEAALHYTSVFSLSRADAARIREILKESLLRTRGMIPASKEEELYCLCCDFFRA